MNSKILNRDAKLPADGWYEIEVAGEHFNRAAGVVQLNDEQSFTAIVNRFKAEAAKPNFGGLLIDRDHFSLDSDKSSEALGWLQEVRNREGHLEGRIEWTSAGQPLVEGKNYKFFSTVYDATAVEKVGTRKIKNRDYPLVRPLALERLALTNDPNNKGGKPISNRNGKSAGAADENTDPTIMKSLLKKLGLAEDASEESAVAALQVIQNRASQVEALTTERNALVASQVESDLEKYKNRFKPENRDTVKKALIANRAGTIELLEATEAPAAVSQTKEQSRITNRAAANTPEAKAASKDNDAKIEAEVQNYRIANRCNYETAHAAVRRSKPELFAAS